MSQEKVRKVERKDEATKRRDELNLDALLRFPLQQSVQSIFRVLGRRSSKAAENGEVRSIISMVR